MRALAFSGMERIDGAPLRFPQACLPVFTGMAEVVSILGPFRSGQTVSGMTGWRGTRLVMV